jgi:hypothetical protein
MTARYTAIVSSGASGQIEPAPPTFPDARAAWAYLADFRRNSEDTFPDWHIGEYTDTVQYLDYAATDAAYGNPHEDWPLNADGTGVIHGDTPGVGDGFRDDDADPDPGMSYLVALTAHTACRYVLDGNDTDGTPRHQCTTHDELEISADAPCKGWTRPPD